MLFSTSQRSLRRRRIELEDGVLERAALFPFFDVEGTTRRVMLTSENSPRIYLLDWHGDLFERRWPRRNRLRQRFSELSDATDLDGDRLASLWHFDPWWVLNAPRYTGHSAVPVLRATNIPGYSRDLTGLWFDGKLRRIAYVAEGSGEARRILRFDREFLARLGRQRMEAPRSHVAAPRRDEWRLRPFWASQRG